MNMILFLKEVKQMNKKLNQQLRLLKKQSQQRTKMILMPSQFWKNAAVAIAFVKMPLLKDIHSAFASQLSAVPFLLEL